MEQNPQPSNGNNLAWHFWFLVSFSLFLIVMFVYYLPLRFLHTVAPDEMHKDDGHMMDSGGHEHGATAYHEEKDVKAGLAVNLNASPVPFESGTSTNLDFFVNTKPGNTPVPASQLEIEHERLMHVVGVRSDMNEFFHIHPVAEQGTVLEGSGIFTIDYTFSKPGLYKIWSDVKQGGVSHVFGHEPLSVGGEGAREEKKVAFGRSVIVGGYQVALSIADTIGKGVANDIAFDIHDSEGSEVQVEPYLGADMHLVIIKDDWTEFMHVHPEAAHAHALNGAGLVREARADTGHAHPAAGMGGAALHGINFHATFPTAGLYRAYAQFRPMGINLPAEDALTATFWIQVGEKAPQSVSANAQWWGLLIVSLIAIGALSFGVSRYLKGDQA